MECKSESKYHLRAGFTVEAAVVMPVAIIAIAGMILFGYKLHDIVTANITANEAAELYSHLPEGGTAEAIYEYGNTRLSSLFSGRRYEISIDAAREGSVVTVSGEEGIRTYEDSGFAPQSFMRKMTLLEKAAENE